METVALDAFRAQRTRQGERLRNGRLAAVEGGVEAADLGDVRQQLGHRVHCAQVVRLVQRRERDEGFQFLQHRGAEFHRRAV